MNSNAICLNDDTEWTFESLDLLATSIDSGCNGIDSASLDCGIEQTGSKKRARNEPCAGQKSKACCEKMRRDKLNNRFQELGSILNFGRPPKTDKSMILSDAARALVQLRSEAEQLKDTIEKLQETIKDLKTEKNDLRDEKMKLKADKERLEEQLRVLSAAPAGYMPYPVAYHAVNMAVNPNSSCGGQQDRALLRVPQCPLQPVNAFFEHGLLSRCKGGVAKCLTCGTASR
ncbi:Transcription factor ILR3 [Acorus calamus]|uniref:Transcription factor ILR3 n=1 Tax=Acorus calamus TaxID=4465 RepID=A0AAV9D4P4_ACOCL|nr:Transcription factor ILR3 [Acorus calamus]